MIINCMGFLTAPLYLFSEFFAGKATEHLIGKGVKADLNFRHLKRNQLRDGTSNRKGSKSRISK